MITLFRQLVDQGEMKDPRAFLPRFRESAHEVAELDHDPAVSTCLPAASTFEAWYYGQRKPTREFRRVLVHMFRPHTFDQLWGPVWAEASLPDDRSDADAVLHDMQRSAVMAARRARDFAMGSERGVLGEETMGLLQDEVERIADAYPRVPLPTIYDDLATAQAEVFDKIESERALPSQLRQLNVMGALLSWHMAKASHDLSDPHSAMIHARAAGACAQHAEHQPLVALVDGLKSLIHYWSGNADRALHSARKGSSQQTGRGTVGVWLASLEARAAALLGDAAIARDALERAEQLRTRVEFDDLDQLGGLLTFPSEKQLYYSVESHVLLGESTPRITEQATAAVEAFSNTVAPYWAFGDQAGSHCNLALVRLHGGDVDGVAEAVRPVLDLPPAQRNRGIVVSAQRVQQALMRGPASTSHLARDLREEIGAYAPLRARPALPQ